MKKDILMLFALTVGITSIAQNSDNTYKSVCVTVKKPSPTRITDGSQIVGTQFNMHEPTIRGPRQTTDYDEYCTMTTNYDLQSNSALGNRIAVWPDGTASVVASWDHSWNSSFPNRGTGYNYYNGYNFGNQPTSRIESEKTGWPTIAALGNGEILASHASGSTKIYYRSTKGQGSWSLRKTFSNCTWPRIAVSGSNDQYVHLVATYQESNSSGGYTNHIYYARSTNSGQTWSDLSELPLVDNSAYGTYRNQLSADDYVIATNGNNVAILLGGYTTEVFYIVSHNNGQTWSKQVVAPFPIQGVHAIDFNDYPYGMTDTISTSDNSHSIAIDNNGVVHVAFGLFRWKVEDSDSYMYWPGMGYGIVYWNSNYVNQQGGHEIPLFGNFSGDSYHPEWMADGKGYTLFPERINELADADGHQHIHFFGVNDDNGNGVPGEYDYLTGNEWHYRTFGLSTLPAISVDESGRLAIIYSVWSETRISNLTGFPYRGAYVTYRDSYGQWYDDAINLTSDFIHQYDEVYSVFASPKGHNGTFWMGYSADEYQGLYLDINDNYPYSNNGVMTDNYIYLVKVSPWGNLPTYTISVSANPTNGGTVSGGGTYAQGSTCTLHATANSGYSFVKWTKNGTQVSTNPTYSFTVTGNAAYVAHFEQSTTYYTVSATANPAGSGFVEGQGTYAQGSTCTLSATPNGNYSFEKWVKDGTQVSTNPSYSFTVTSNANCAAYFVPTYTITATANPTTGGSVTGGGTYAQGSTCTLRATPNNGYSFVNWTKNGVQVSTNLDYNFTVTGSEAFVANFERDPVEYTITVNADPAAGGTVSGGGTYTEGSTCVISAMPNSGYVFENWTLNGAEVSINPSYSFIVRRNATYIAHFAQNANQATITATANPVEGGAVSGGGTYELGTTCTLNAVAATGYEFVKWTQDGNTVSTEATFSFTVTSNAVYVAHFNKLVNNYTVSVSLEPSQSAGSVIGAGTYEEGASCTLIAIANPTFTFVSWTENEAVVSTDDHYTFTVERNRSLVAVFSQGLFYTITASAGANGAITPEGEIIVEPGQDKTFAIIPDNGCLVSKVLVDGVDIGPVESYTFRSVNANHSIRAQFSGLGVDDNISLNLKIYPNPANDKINIESPNMKRVSIFNLFGIQIESKDVKDDHTAFSTVNLPQGTYILKVENNDGRIGWSQFVVVK